MAFSGKGALEGVKSAQFEATDKPFGGYDGALWYDQAAAAFKVIVNGGTVATLSTGTAAGNVTAAASLASGNVVTGAGSSAIQDSGTALTALAPLVSPSFTTPAIGAATGSSLSVTGQLTSTVATGTAPLVVSSTTNVANLNAATLNGTTFAAPGAIGGTTPAAGAFTTLSGTGTITAGANGGTAGQLALNGSTSGTQTCTTSATGNSATCGGTWAFSAANVTGNYQVNGKLFVSTTAPSISSGFGVGASIASNNGTGGFTINVGTGGSATSGVIGLPAAVAGWNCFVSDLTTTSTTVFMTKQTASGTATATIGNFSTAGTAAAWVASDILAVSCFAH